MIERRNIIKLLSDRVNVYHSAILTCFNFDPIFFESVMLPTLKRQGVTNIIVLVDAGMYDQMMTDMACFCHRAAMNGYTIVRQDNAHKGVFHAKMLLLFGVDEGVVIVGSGNLTFSGMSNNAEIWNAFHVKGSASPNYALLKAGWEYAKGLLSNAPSLVCRQLEWIEEQSEWIETVAESNIVMLDNGDTATFLCNGKEGTIYDVLRRTITETVTSITLVAPFYDAKGEAVKTLSEVFRPKSIRCMLDMERQSAPYDLIGGQLNIEFYEYTDKKSPLHAKVIEIETSSGSWLLAGSANIGNMALGINNVVYNDEACILLHSEIRKSFIKELGLEDSFKSMSEDELKIKERSKDKDCTRTDKSLTILACELYESEMRLTIDKRGEECCLVVMNRNLDVVSEFSIVTEMQITVSIDDSAYLVVLQKEGKEISNRCLVLSELNVERCNPNPQRRKLSSLLDDSELADNLSHILGFVEFDECKIEQQRTHIGGYGQKDKKDDLGKTVSCEHFDDLKNNSALSVNMHSGVRIVSFLKDILFRENMQESNEDELLELQKENEKNTDGKPAFEKREPCEEDLGIKLYKDVYGFLDKMKQFLLSKAGDESVQEEGQAILPLEGKGILPKMTARPGLNESSSFGVAVIIVAYLKKNYANIIIKKVDVRERFYECICLFLSIYGRHFKQEGNSYKERKSYEMLKDATTMMLVSMCYFDFGKRDYQLILTVLNSLWVWKDDKKALAEIVNGYHKKVIELGNSVIIDKSYSLVNSVIDVCMNAEPSVRILSECDDKLFVYKEGYGFFYVDNVKQIDGKWHFSYHHPRYYNSNVLLSGITKYKGYRYSDF